MSRRFAGCSLIAVALFSVQPVRGAERFTQSTDVVAVEVPVQVLKDGVPVRGLTAADFEVTAGRTRETVTGFETLDLKSIPADSPAAMKAVPPSGRRRFLLFFDLTFSNQLKVKRAQDAALRLLASGFHPTDLIGVASYRPNKGPELLLNFTPDRKSVETTIDQIGFADQARLAFDPLELTSLGGGGGGGPSMAGAGKAADRAESQGGEEAAYSGYDPFIGSALASTAHMVERETRDNRQRDLNAFLKSVQAFAGALSSVQGRKNVILLSEGFDSALILGTSDIGEQDSQNVDSMFGQYWGVDSEKRFGDTKSTNNLEKMLEALRRADCVVQAIDIGGVRGQKAGGEDGLFVMANSTGGELYRNFNNLSEAVGKMLERTSVTYVLTFQPDVKRDGEYHKIRVELKDKSLGKVVYRPGFYSPLPFAKQRPIEKRLRAAGSVVSGREGGQIDLAVLAAPFATPGPKAYVPVVIEIGGASLLGDAKEGTLPAEIYVYALDAKGEVSDYFTQTLGLDLAKLGASVRAGGVKFFGDVELAPGSYSIRVLVRNGLNGIAGLKIVPVEVPAFSEGKPVLLPVFFPAPTDRWLIAREAQAKEREKGSEVPYPFMNHGQPFVPASLPALRAEAATRVSLVGYRLGEGSLSAQAMILDAGGNEAGQGNLQITGREPGEGGVHRLAATFKPPKLNPGDYTLLLTLTDAKGASETSATPFVIAPAAAPAGAGG